MIVLPHGASLIDRQSTVYTWLLSDVMVFALTFE